MQKNIYKDIIIHSFTQSFIHSIRKYFQCLLYTGIMLIPGNVIISKTFYISIVITITKIYIHA